MELRKGIAASPGYAIGEAFILDSEQYRIEHRALKPAEVDAEAARFNAALLRAQAEVEGQIAKVAKKVGPEILKIVRGHLDLLGDPLMAQEIVGSIRKSRCNAEYSVSSYLRKKKKVLESVNQDWAARIGEDLRQVEQALLRQLLGEGREDIHHLREKVVVVAHDLTPAQTADFDRDKILGILTDKGGKTSHTSLVASSLGIPAVVGLGSITSEVSGGDTVIIDGLKGTVLINPDSTTTKKYQALQKNYFLVDRKLSEQYRHAPAQTKDGRRITIYANIDSPSDAAAALEYGAEGIGLFRTEYLFLNRPDPPDEREHMDAYLKAVKTLGNRWFTIRTLDLGADKMAVEGIPRQSNPFLGVRAIRLCFERMDLFVAQLRAILRISTAGNMGIMVPLVSTLQEVQQVREILEETKRQLRREGEVFVENMPLGIMIEVPAAALAIDLLMPHVDFVSVGTNDLVAYVMAVDRANEKLADLYQPAHPAVLRLLKRVFESAQAANKPASVCGEMSSDMVYVPLLLGLGLRTFSVVPHMIPEVKRVLRAFTLEEAADLADKAMQMSDAAQIEEYLRERIRQHLPEII